MLRVGLVGTEESIRRHIHTLHHLPLVNISGYLCPGIGKIENISAPAFDPSSLEEFVDRSDTFIFSGIGIEYYHYAIQALRSSRHIFFDEYVLNAIDKLANIQKLSAEANTYVHVRNDRRLHPSWNFGRKMVSKPQYAEFLLNESPGNGGFSNEIWVKRLSRDIDLLLDLFNVGIKRTSPTGISVMQQNIDLLNLKIEFINGSAANLNYRLMPESRFDRCTLYEKGSVVDIDFLNYSVSRKSQYEQKKFSIAMNSALDNELENFIEYLIHTDQASSHPHYDFMLPLQISIQTLEKIQRRHSVHFA